MGFYEGNSCSAEKETYGPLSPISEKLVAAVVRGSKRHYERCVEAARSAFDLWSDLPMPRRGDIVRQIGYKLREHKRDLGMLIGFEIAEILANHQSNIASDRTTHEHSAFISANRKWSCLRLRLSADSRLAVREISSC